MTWIRKSNENTIVSIPGKEWQTMRFDNIGDYSNVVFRDFVINVNHNDLL